MRSETELNNQLIEDGIYAAALDPTKSLGAPTRREPVPHFNFAPLRNALKRLQAAASDFDAAISENSVTSEEINSLLFTTERLLTRDESLNGRPWYKHHVYAPGFYTGYGVKTIPGVREAIEQREYDIVDEQIKIAAVVLQGMAERIELVTSKIAGRQDAALQHPELDVRIWQTQIDSEGLRHYYHAASQPAGLLLLEVNRWKC